jgi:hypothetical protein
MDNPYDRPARVKRPDEPVSDAIQRHVDHYKLPMTPRAERACENCDHSRIHGRGELKELRCHYNPPQPWPMGIEPPLIDGALPKPIVFGIWAPCTWPCSKWRLQEPDHPDLHRPIELPAQTHESTGKVQ